MEPSINIKGYISIFKRRIWLVFMIIGISIGVGVLAKYKAEKYYVPVYQANTRIRINSNKNNPQQGFSPAVTTLNQSISSSYLGLAKSKSTLEYIIDKIGIDITPQALASKYTLTPDESNSEFINISVEDKDPKMAANIADIIPAAYNEELIKTINMDCIQRIEVAQIPTNPLPQPKSTVVVKVAMIGIVASVFIVLLLEFLNNKIITPEDVEEYWGLPMVGVVPYSKLHKKRKKELKTQQVEVK